MELEGKGVMRMKRVWTSTNQEQEYVKEQLVQFNLQHIPVEKKHRKLGFHIKDDNEKIIAGINGVLYWDHTCLHIQIIWVDELHRQQDLGSRLLEYIEREAKRCGAQLSHLETMDFQAKAFYVKHGYEPFGVLDDCPEGHRCFYLKKKLKI